MADTFLVIGTGPTVNLVLSGVGASAYAIWLEAGNAGTEQDFLDSLVGATGPTGATGPQGDPGFVSLNGLTNPTQTFATGTTGTDFGISSSGSTHTFNLPSSSASNRGLLLAMDWAAFNAKIGGSGTSGYLPKFTGSATVANSIISEGASGIGIGVVTPAAKIHVVGSGSTSAAYTAQFHNSTGSNHTLSLRDDGRISINTISDLYSNLTMDANSSDTAQYSNVNFGLDIRNRNSANNTWAGVLFSAAGGSGAAAVQTKFIDKANAYGEIRFTTRGAATGLSNKVVISSDGPVGFSTASPTSTIDANGANGYSQLRLRTTYTPTSSADALGNTGDTAWDANYFYIKTASGWKRSALSTF